MSSQVHKRYSPLALDILKKELPKMDMEDVGKEINQIQNDRKDDQRKGVSTFAIRTNPTLKPIFAKKPVLFQRFRDTSCSGGHRLNI